jgi:hypothetical protein
MLLRLPLMPTCGQCTQLAYAPLQTPRPLYHGHHALLNHESAAYPCGDPRKHRWPIPTGNIHQRKQITSGYRKHHQATDTTTHDSAELRYTHATLWSWPPVWLKIEFRIARTKNSATTTHIRRQKTTPSGDGENTIMGLTKTNCRGDENHILWKGRRAASEKNNSSRRYSSATRKSSGDANT